MDNVKSELENNNNFDLHAVKVEVNEIKVEPVSFKCGIYTNNSLSVLNFIVLCCLACCNRLMNCFFNLQPFELEWNYVRGNTAIQNAYSHAMETFLECFYEVNKFKWQYIFGLEFELIPLHFIRTNDFVVSSTDFLVLSAEKFDKYCHSSTKTSDRKLRRMV